jgi:hypothetical protein
MRTYSFGYCQKSIMANTSYDYIHCVFLAFYNYVGFFWCNLRRSMNEMIFFVFNCCIHCIHLFITLIVVGRANMPPTKHSSITKHFSKLAQHSWMAVGEATSVIKCFYELKIFWMCKDFFPLGRLLGTIVGSSLEKKQWLFEVQQYVNPKP